MTSIGSLRDRIPKCHRCRSRLVVDVVELCCCTDTCGTDAGVTAMLVPPWPCCCCCC